MDLSIAASEIRCIRALIWVLKDFAHSKSSNWSATRLTHIHNSEQTTFRKLIRWLLKVLQTEFKAVRSEKSIQKAQFERPKWLGFEAY